MLVRDELNHKIIFQIPLEELLSIFQIIKTVKEEEIEAIKNKINKFELKKRAEEAFYQSLSPVRKFFASRTPSHHQAVEYIVHVKDRIKQISLIKQSIFEIDHAIKQLHEKSLDNEIVLSSMVIEEIMMYRKLEDYQV